MGYAMHEGDDQLNNQPIHKKYKTDEDINNYDYIRFVSALDGTLEDVIVTLDHRPKKITAALPRPALYRYTPSTPIIQAALPQSTAIPASNQIAKLPTSLAAATTIKRTIQKETVTPVMINITFLPCPTQGCRHLFSTEEALDKHVSVGNHMLKTQCPAKKIPVICPECGKTVSNKYYLKEHQNTNSCKKSVDTQTSNNNNNNNASALNNVQQPPLLFCSELLTALLTCNEKLPENKDIKKK